MSSPNGDTGNNLLDLDDDDDYHDDAVSLARQSLTSGNVKILTKTIFIFICVLILFRLCINVARRRGIRLGNNFYESCSH